MPRAICDGTRADRCGDACNVFTHPVLAVVGSSLGGMESLSGLSELKLEREEVEGRTAGPWKEMIKNDGRIWCAR